jgi:hypothetical protein
LLAKHLGALPKPNKIKAVINAVSFDLGDYGLPNYHVAPPPANLPRRAR